MEKKNDEFGKLIQERGKDKYADAPEELKKKLSDLQNQLAKARNRPNSAQVPCIVYIITTTYIFSRHFVL